MVIHWLELPQCSSDILGISTQNVRLDVEGLWWQTGACVCVCVPSSSDHVQIRKYHFYVLSTFCINIFLIKMHPMKLTRRLTLEWMWPRCGPDVALAWYGGRLHDHARGTWSHICTKGRHGSALECFEVVVMVTPCLVIVTCQKEGINLIGTKQGWQ